MIDFSLDGAIDVNVETALEEGLKFVDIVHRLKLDPSRDFIGEDLSRVDFDDAELFGFNFSDANLSNADISKAKTLGANFNRANVTGAKLPDSFRSATIEMLAKKIIFSTNFLEFGPDPSNMYNLSVYHGKDGPLSATDVALASNCSIQILHTCGLVWYPRAFIDGFLRKVTQLNWKSAEFSYTKRNYERHFRRAPSLLNRQSMVLTIAEWEEWTGVQVIENKSLFSSHLNNVFGATFIEPMNVYSDLEDFRQRPTRLF